eukprot:4718673-Prymnesium_polylepis.1
MWTDVYILEAEFFKNRALRAREDPLVSRFQPQHYVVPQNFALLAQYVAKTENDPLPPRSTDRPAGLGGG